MTKNQLQDGKQNKNFSSRRWAFGTETASYIYKKIYRFLELVGECQNAIEAKREIERQTVDAIFIDINMPDMSGLDFVRSLEVKPLVVFTTAYSDYAIEGYKVEAIDYLLKPFSQERTNGSS